MVVVVGGGGGAVVVVGGGGGAVVVVVVGAGAVVVVDEEDADVDDVAGARYATRCERRFTPSLRELPTPLACAACGLWTARDALCTRGELAAEFCNNRRGAPKSTPQMIAATPRRLPPVLWFRRAPPFSGDSVHPRRHTGGEGFLENLDNQSQHPQTRKAANRFAALFSQVTPHGGRDI